MRAGDVKTFENFIVPMPAAVDLAGYTICRGVVRKFSEFITAVAYRCAMP
jgi:hypothetical protein